jgi:cation-transporting ATPase 13A1
MSLRAAQQVFSVLLWMLDDYWMYSVVTLAMLCLLEVTVVKQRIRNSSMLSKLRKKPYTINVLREVSV